MLWSEGQFVLTSWTLYPPASFLQKLDSLEFGERERRDKVPVRFGERECEGVDQRQRRRREVIFECLAHDLAHQSKVQTHQMYG